MQKLLRILRNILLSLLGLITVLLVLVNMSSVQTYLAQKASTMLADKLKTKVAVQNVRIELLNHVLLEGLYIEDHHQDTLAYIGKVELRITDWFFLKPTTPVLHYVGLNNAFINLQRTATSPAWNYAFIEDAFASPKSTKPKQSGSVELDLEKLMLDNVRVRMDDAWTGYDYDIDIGSLLTNVEEIDFTKKAIVVSRIDLANSSIRLRDYKGGKPPTPKKPMVIDTTAFNPDEWTVNMGSIKLDDCHFRFVNKEGKPYPNEFDPEYIEVSRLNAEILDLRIVGDTLRARMEHFSALERSGFEVKQMQSIVSVSPRASICRDLLLQTNNSTLGNYYAMHYERFPDFTDYIRKVRMDARLVNAKIDPKDIAYFAPQLRQLPVGICKVSGKGGGTVDALFAQNLDITDGYSTVKGDLRITGLPDVDVSIFDFQNGEIFTTGNSVLRYAPMLKDNPNINLQAVDYAYFKGSFTGLLSDFAAKGTLTTNLGNIAADMKMKLPETAQPTYSGVFKSEGFDAGRFLNQPSLGKTTFDAELEGASFDADGFHINAKSTFDAFTFNGYTYRNIIADGVFDKNKFDGSLLINDSNLSMGFYGSIDLNEDEIKVNATANLLSSDLRALHFVAAPTTLTADFDLNCAGHNIDDFIGTAKLYNINLNRHKQRMDLDSININAYTNEGGKNLDIESNLLSAKINGQFLLSEIPNSMQFYLSKYLPNYIKSPERIAADQNLNFDIETREVNDLLLAFTKVLSGFDNAKLSGNLNTSTQKLNIDAQVPFGKIADLKLSNAVVKGEGNYNSLQLKADIASFVIGANVLNTSLSIDARVANDSVQFAINTKSAQQYGTATLQGMVYANEDSLLMSLAPSEFYINNAKWEIPSGNSLVYAQRYLNVQNLKMVSGLQKIEISSPATMVGNPLKIKTYNLDVAQLASLTTLASAQPEGRINGEIVLDRLFAKPKIAANLEVVGVKIYGDSLGLIKLNGVYDGETETVTLADNANGIYNDKFSMVAYGQLALASDSKDQLKGGFQLSNFPTKTLSPILVGYVSQLGGTIDGSVSIGGRFSKPDFKGSLQLRNIAAKVDYTGAFYTIPLGNINLNGDVLKLDDIAINDVYKNTAIASGNIKFNTFSNPQFNLRLSADDFEVVNLRELENDLFYGHVIAKANFTITGRVDNLSFNINATPTQKSQLYLPYNAAGDYSNSTYISFKSYETKQDTIIRKQKDKLSVRISAVLNNLIDVSLILDPKSGDQISANGNGNLSINVPANEDYSMFGTYNIERGRYLFTYRQVLSKEFKINAGSTIAFAGNISNTRLNVDATYPTTARLIDLLDDTKAKLISGTKEEDDAKTTQAVNIKLRMTGTLEHPDLNYEIELPEKRSVGTTAYAELTRINSSDQTALTNQVSSLLFLGSFIPSQGLTSTLAVTGAKNTLGETIASQASPLLTTALNKLLGDQKIQVLVQYKSFGQDATSTTTSTTATVTDTRNQVKLGLKKNYFNDRLSLQIGSAYDWGRPTTTDQSASSFNLAGDFRAQYHITADGGVSFVGFRASNYDLFYGYNILRQGVGISVRKSFDNFYEFIHSKKRIAREQQAQNKARSGQ